MLSISRLLAVGTLLSIGFSPVHPNIAALNQEHDPSQSSSGWYQQDKQKFAVTEVGYDDIGKILDSAGFAYDSIQIADLVNYELIKQYDVIFINCSEKAGINVEEAKESLEQYVREGGKLYASDFAFQYVAEAFPGYVNFYKYDEGFEDEGPYAGLPDQTVTADILDPGLQQELNSQTVEIYFDLAGWIVIESVSDTVHVVLSGDFETIGTQEMEKGETLTDKPLSVSFPYGEGYVLYTSYHNEVGDQPVTPAQQTLLEYLVRAAAAPEILATPIPTLAAENTDSGRGVPVYIIVLACLLCMASILVVAAVVGFFVLRKRSENSLA